MQYLQLNNIDLEIHNYNDDFILLKNRESDNLPLIGEAIFETNFDFVQEVIATKEEIYIKLSEKINPNIITRLSQINWQKTKTVEPVILPIHFDENADWATVSSVTNLSQAKYIERLLMCDLSVEMYGFMPGFVYLKGLDSDLRVPRKSTPNKRIPSNSFAIGGPYAGIYSLTSPGGWYEIGTLAIPVFERVGIPPLRVKINQKIKLQAITHSELKAIQSEKSNKY